MYSDALTWWSLLCGISLINILAWTASAGRLRQRHQVTFSRPQDWSILHWQLFLSAGYVLGCAYRSVFPVFDVQRIVMFDTWFSSVFMGRTVATVAELCFAAQWALLLRNVAQSCGSVATFHVSRLIVPLILMAETFSWYSVLTTSNIGHVIEETIWGLCAMLLVCSFVYLWPRSHRSLRPTLLLVSAAGFAYALYMFLVDVPMYWTRWLVDEGRGHTYLDLAQGLADTSSRWIVSHHWKDWETEVIWMSLYFSVAVWLSIGLMHVASLLSAVHFQAQIRLPPQPRAYRLHI